MSTPNLKFFKTRDVKSPRRANPTDAGIDLYVPNDLNVSDIVKMDATTHSKTEYEYCDDNWTIKSFTVNPGQSMLIPVGIKVKFDDGYALIGFNKSGVASKKHMLLGACVIDSGYQGEVFVNLNNVGTEPVVFNKGDALTQVVLVPISLVQAEEVNSLDELYNGETTSRGEGCLGSTN